MQDFQEKIEALISLGYEDFWDYKEVPHENKASLLHDILCMANSSNKNDSFLILGVSDKGDIKGLIGLPNRKSQANLIDFLRSKSFAGGVWPKVSVKSLVLSEKEIDVIIVHKNHSKPFYLTKDFADRKKLVKANYIYTRNGDTNTPINENASFHQIELMWKERFGLNLPTTERFKTLMKSSPEWFNDIGNKKYLYHKIHPEFRIKLGKHKEKKKIFSFFFANESSFEGSLKFLYHSTILYEKEFIYCDELNVFLPQPNIDSVKLVNGKKKYFYYFDLSDWLGSFLILLKNLKVSQNYWQLENFEPFLIFNNNEELCLFKKFVEENPEMLDQYPVDVSYIKSRIIESNVTSFTNDPEFMAKIYLLWKEKCYSKLNW